MGSTAEGDKQRRAHRETQNKPEQSQSHVSELSVPVKNTKVGGSAWWLSGEEPTCQRRRGGLSAWPGKTAHAAEQPSPCTTTAEPVSRTREPQLLSPTPQLPRAPMHATGASTSTRRLHISGREQPLVTKTREKFTRQLSTAKSKLKPS